MKEKHPDWYFKDMVSHGIGYPNDNAGKPIPAIVGVTQLLIPKGAKNVPVAKDFGAFLGQFTLPDWRGFLQPEVWSIGAVIAVVASIESLLCIEATDKLVLKKYDPVARKHVEFKEAKIK